LNTVLLPKVFSEKLSSSAHMQKKPQRIQKEMCHLKNLSAALSE